MKVLVTASITIRRYIDHINFMFCWWYISV